MPTATIPSPEPRKALICEIGEIRERIKFTLNLLAISFPQPPTAFTFSQSRARLKSVKSLKIHLLIILINNKKTTIMKRKKFSGIFAAVFVAATVITLASCSQDDEYYEDGLFTRADEMMTRSGEQGGYTPTPPTLTPVPEDTIERAYIFHFGPNEPVYGDSLPAFDVSIDVRLFKRKSANGSSKELVAEMIGHGMPYNLEYQYFVHPRIGVLEASFIVNELRLEADSPLDDQFKLRASGRILRWSDYWNDNWPNDWSNEWPDNWSDNEESIWEQDSFSYIGEVSNRIFY